MVLSGFGRRKTKPNKANIMIQDSGFRVQGSAVKAKRNYLKKQTQFTPKGVECMQLDDYIRDIVVCE